MIIVGTGALACLFAARLAAAGEPVTMLGSWPEGLAALAEHGVRLSLADGHQAAYPVKIARQPAECAGEANALVLVKSWQTGRAGQQLASCLPADGLALSLQNGLGNREILASQLGERRVALGVTTLGATLLGPGWVRAGGNGIISLASQPRLAPFEMSLCQAGFEVEVVSDPFSLVWAKLVISAAINPLTALLEICNGQLLENEDTRRLMGAAALEAAQVAAGLGIQLPYSDPIAAVEAVARKTASNRSSMLQDIARQAPTEIEAICGAIVELGRESQISIPVTEVLWHLVRAKVEKASRPAE